MARFDNDEVVAIKQAELRETRELAAAARAHERAEQAQAHELDGPE